MSTKSNGLKQKLAANQRQIKALQQLVIRQSKGAMAIVQIALMYGDHHKNCATKGETTAPDAVCTCQWDQAKTLLSPEVAAPAEHGVDTLPGVVGGLSEKAEALVAEVEQ